MIGRIVEIADDRRHLFVNRGFMVVRDTEGEHKELGQVPLDDIAAVIANAHGISYTNNLLVALAERAGRVLTRDQIMEVVRGRELEAFDRSIDVHMGRIRAAIELDPKNPKRILTVRGVGYVFAKQQD